MNDRPGTSASADDDTPEIAEVRRLLAEARHTEPMPEEVAARLERVLGRLGDETPAAIPEPRSTSGVVIPIAAHRRRRAAGLLAAAAAIVVGGVVASEVFHTSSSQNGATAAPAAQDHDFSSGDSVMPNSTKHPPVGPGTDGQQVQPELRHGRVVVRPQHFSFDALSGRALLDRATARTTESQDLKYLQDCGSLAKSRRTVPAEYQNAPAALVYRRPQGGAQVVYLYVCGSSQPIRTTTLPAP